MGPTLSRAERDGSAAGKAGGAMTGMKRMAKDGKEQHWPAEQTQLIF